MDEGIQSKRVLLVDDNPAIRDQIAQVLRGEFDVVETIPDGTSWQAALDRSRPDLIVLDIMLPGPSGFELTRHLATSGCPARIVFLTVQEDADFAREALAVGGLGYVVKSRLGTDLLAALRAAAEGRRFVSPCPALAEFIRLNGSMPTPVAADADGAASLRTRTTIKEDQQPVRSSHMNTKPKAMMWTIALAAGLALAAGGPCNAQLPASDLGVLDGCEVSHAAAVNSSGQIVGYCANLVWDEMEGDFVEDGKTDLPFVWQNGTMTLLPLLAGFTAGSPVAINSSGQIVGSCWTAGWSSQACLWTRNDTGWTVAGLGVPADCTGSWARMINDAGQIVLHGGKDKWPWSRAYFRDSQGNETLLQDSDSNFLSPCQMNGSGQIVAFVGNNSGLALWHDGAVTDLVPFPGFDAWINDLGQVVGAFPDESSLPSVPSDFIYLPEAAYGLPAGLNTWPVSVKGGYFGGLNNAGQVLLVADPAPDGADWFTTDVQVIQLGGSVVSQLTLPGDTGFPRIRMNGKGQIVGDFQTADYTTSCFFADPVTGFTLLGSLGGPASWPAGLNDSGMIIGESLLADGTVHACIWLAQYSWSGVLQPINADGSSVFKAGRTVPVKFKLAGTSAGITTLAATISYAQVSSGSVGAINESVSTSAATTGNRFRYDAASGQYIFNWSTKGLKPGTYRLFINLGDGVPHTVDIGLK